MGEIVLRFLIGGMWGLVGAVLYLGTLDSVRAMRRLLRKKSNRGRITQVMVQIGDRVFPLPGGMETLKLHPDGTPLGMKPGDPPDPDNLAAIGGYMRWAEQLLHEEQEAKAKEKEAAREQEYRPATDPIVT